MLVNVGFTSFPRFQNTVTTFFSIALAARRPAQERKDHSVPVLIPAAPRFVDSGSAVPCRLDAVSERVKLGGLVIRETGEEHLSVFAMISSRSLVTG